MEKNTHKQETLKIHLHDQTYTLNEFCKLYDLSYATAYRYYQQKGLRDSKLFDALVKQKYSNVSVLGKSFSSLKSASKYFQVPYTTFLRKHKNGTLQDYLAKHNRHFKENSQ